MKCKWCDSDAIEGGTECSDCSYILKRYITAVERSYFARKSGKIKLAKLYSANAKALQKQAEARGILFE